MTKRPSLRDTLPKASDEVAQAVASTQALQLRQQKPPESDVPFVTTTIHLPRPLLTKLRQAAMARADKIAETEGGSGGRPSVSAVVVELLEKHLDELSG